MFASRAIREAGANQLLWTITVGIATPFVVLVIFGAVVAWNVLMAPSRMEQDATNANAAEVSLLATAQFEALERVQALERERIPGFHIVPNGGNRQMDWDITDHLMWAELRVTNTSPTVALRGVQVQVTDLSYVAQKLGAGAKDEFVLLNEPEDWHTLNVLWTMLETSSPQVKIDIPPGTTQTALVAFSDNPNGPPASLNAPNSPRSVHLSEGAKIRLEVSSTNSALWGGDFFIHCHPRYVTAVVPYHTMATIEFMTWEEWMANHKLTTSSIFD